MVVALAGRRIDAPDADVPRFPSEAVGDVRDRLLDLLEAQGATALVASGACGADLVAHDVAGALGLRRRLVLPFSPDRFRVSSVTDRPDAAHDWGALFDRVVAETEASGDLVVLSAGEGDAAYAAASASIQAEAARLAGPDAPLAVVVWEGTPRGPSDLTALFRDDAQARGWPVIEVPTTP